MQYTLKELLAGLEASVRGDENCSISGIGTIQDAKPDQITFLTNSHYRKYLADTKAAAVILTADDAKHYAGNAVICANPYYIYARIAYYFQRQQAIARGIHPTVTLGENCEIHPEAQIGANCVIHDRVKIAKGVKIGPQCIIQDDCTIDEDSELDARVTLYHEVHLGKRVHLSSGVVIGSDGFGFANQKGVWHKVPQLGGVIVGDDVDVGANTTIDRGAIASTIIEEGVKLDNLIQVGHNVRIGAHTVIAGCTAIAGSTVIGKYCMIGGASCFAGHISICDRVIITGMTAVTKSITEPGMYSSGIVGAVPNLDFRKNNARFHRLEQLMQRVKALENSLKETERKPT